MGRKTKEGKKEMCLCPFLKKKNCLLSHQFHSLLFAYVCVFVSCVCASVPESVSV